MRPRFVISMLVGVVLLATTLTLPASSQALVRVFVDGDQVLFDQPPIILGSRVLVPLRGVFEKMGATVEWHPPVTVVAARGSTLVELRIGSQIAKVNNQAVTMDVPAIIINGRTLVPLRFISESLGARVEWSDATRTVLIFSSGAAAPPPPAPPPAGQTIKGVISQVTPAQSASDRPQIIVESGNILYRITITVDTAITRIELTSNTGGSVGVAALKPGDDAEVTTAGGIATRIRATYQITEGRIEAIARASRTLVLSDGRSIRYIATVLVEVNGQAAQNGTDALRTGQIVQLRLNPTTKEAWEINIIAGATKMPPPEMTLAVTTPKPGDTVSNPIVVAGSTAPGSRVEIMVTWFLGFQVGRQVVTADARGGFTTRVPITVVAANSPYLITVTATNDDLGQRQQQFTVAVK